MPAVGLHLTAGIGSVATLSLLTKAHMTTIPGRANVGVGLAVPPSLIALGISIATRQTITCYGRTMLMLLATTLLVPSLLLLFLIQL